MKQNNAKPLKKKVQNDSGNKTQDGHRKKKLKPIPKVKYKTQILEEE